MEDEAQHCVSGGGSSTSSDDPKYFVGEFVEFTPPTVSMIGAPAHTMGKLKGTIIGVHANGRQYTIRTTNLRPERTFEDIDESSLKLTTVSTENGICGGWQSGQAQTMAYES